ncbi:DUF2235 domain-containing protein [Streptomyces sp. SID13726]|uniref:DUF2235 domain-containing protein n=1 Tax=Streptomyces sp. SID13726 TaxID=2706058 RepID=UPI0013BCBDE3|nr:DUF2235 domain-containing protein [Streptomyces sp. SID13726]NEB05063.1 DUF2235 domain-containing protein [Streptomyces sp. SID13726]
MAKHLVVCCDGTWNVSTQRYRTNAAKVARAVVPVTTTGTEQRVRCLDGVGTKASERLRGGAFGWGLSEKVRDAYRFLVENFEPGDELYLFGFSRGAFTARSLAGLVRNSGVLRLEHENRLDEAWALYRDRGKKPGDRVSEEFRADYSHTTRIRFVGVWDTVGALGIPVPGPRVLRPLASFVNHFWAFHDTELSSWVDGAFHALAVDEERRAFEPTLWHQQSDAVGQELKQVWFSGSHVDVGGGHRDTSQSDLSLRWMVANATRYGLEFDDAALGAGPFTPLGGLHDSRTGLYRLTRPLHRPIGQARLKPDGPLDGHELLADTTELRFTTTPPPYDPPQLAKYLSKPEDVHIERIPGPSPELGQAA